MGTFFRNSLYNVSYKRTSQHLALADDASKGYFYHEPYLCLKENE